MTRPLRFLVCLTALCGSAISAPAASEGRIGIASDYILRGVSQSDGRPALQAELQYPSSANWSVGAQVSQVRLRPSKITTEVNAFVQWRKPVSPDFDLSATATHYAYPNDPRAASYQYNELALTMGWRDQLYLTAAWTPQLNLYSTIEGFAPNREIMTLETSAHRDLSPHWDLRVGLGYYHPVGLDYATYGYGNATVGWHYGHWLADVGWFWVQNARHRQYSAGPAGGPLAGSLAWSF